MDASTISPSEPQPKPGAHSGPAVIGAPDAADCAAPAALLAADQLSAEPSNSGGDASQPVAF